MERLLSTGVFQSEHRQMRVSVGDILTFSAVAQGENPTKRHLNEVCEIVYRPHSLDLLIRQRLEAAYRNSTVFCWVIHNATASLAKALHNYMKEDPAYLGAMDVDFSRPEHLLFFRNKLPEMYRFHGTNFTFFYSMGMDEGSDMGLADLLRSHGFNVDREDRGARRTIFDDFDTLEHFKRIEDFKNIFAQIDGVGDDLASDLTLSLEELHPKLFDALASAARSMERAETSEDLAQAALTGRRILERIADYLFPPQDDDHKGHKVGQAEYRNRLWAYVDQTIDETEGDMDLLSELGGECDRLVELFNSGLHAEPSHQKIECAFRDLVKWLAAVIDISPSSVRRPYLAYGDNLIAMLRESIDRRSEVE